MLRVGQDLLGCAALHDLARAHDEHLVRDIRHDGQIVADEEEGLAGGSALGEQLEDLRLDRRVQGGRGLIRDEDLRSRCDGRRDERSLAQPTGQLGRPFLRAEGGGGDACVGEELVDAFAAGSAGQVRVQAQGLVDLLPDPSQRVQ